MTNFGLELRASQESRNIYGQAITFETESSALPWIEIIHRGAVTEDTIKESDIIFTYNHDRNQVLARSYKGEGSLHIDVREDGVYFDFDAPNTRFGDEILEQVRRGDLMRCSFCFDLNEDDFKRSIREDGQRQVDIYRINKLYDLSVVVDPAYDSTFINSRAADLGLDDIKTDEEKENVSDNNTNPDNSDTDNNGEGVKEEDVDKDNKEENKEEKQEEKTEERTCSDEEKEQRSSETNSNIFDKKTMEKQFSLLRAIRSIANNQKLDDIDAAVINAGAAEFRKAGVEFGGQIQLPNLIENRSAITVTSEGEDVVATDIYDILEPLRARNVLVQAGAKFMTGLVGNVQVPVMSASNVTWEGETASAGDGAGTFTHVTLSPKRLTAYIDISKQFLVQDGVGAENVIREDLIKAINSKLENTILGSASGTTAKPAGIFYSQTLTSVSQFEDICDLEAGVEEANVLGELKYIVSPKAKAALRGMIKGTNATGMVYENSTVDGTPALETTNVASNLLVVGDFSNLAIGQWGAIDLVVDPYTKAADGQVRLVVNAFFDAKVLRNGVFGFGETA